MAESEIMIVPIIKSEKYLFKKIFKKPLQNRKIRISVRIKNIGKVPTEKFRIKNIEVTSSQNYTNKFNKELDINPLNPGEIIDITFGSIICPVSGQTWVRFKTDPNNIKTYQVDPCSSEPDFLQNGEWEDFFQIIDEHVYHQKIMNCILVILAFFMATPIIMELFLYFFKLLK